MALKAIRITMFHGVFYPGKGSKLSCARERVRLCPQKVFSQQVIPISTFVFACRERVRS